MITAGIARKPGMSRDDLLNTNFGIMSDVAGKGAGGFADAIFIIVSNPLDAMAQTAFKKLGLPRGARDRDVAGGAGFGAVPHVYCRGAEGVG